MGILIDRDEFLGEDKHQRIYTASANALEGTKNNARTMISLILTNFGHWKGLTAASASGHPHKQRKKLRI